MSEILEGAYGYDVVARVEGNEILEGRFGYNIVGRYEGGCRSGAAAAAYFLIL